MIDIYAPLDAAHRLREMREQIELEDAKLVLESSVKFAKAIRKILRRRKDGGIDRRYGPRLGPPR